MLQTEMLSARLFVFIFSQKKKQRQRQKILIRAYFCFSVPYVLLVARQNAGGVGGQRVCCLGKNSIAGITLCL
jgi:hypothetical protein